ncbi:MAG: glycerate kinase type-2 family protein [Candidatus Promineifilaceae bacterium]
MPAPAFADHRQHIDQLIASGLAAADPAAAVGRHLARRGAEVQVAGRRYGLRRGGVYLISVGKAALPMAAAAAAILGNAIQAGVVIPKRGRAAAPRPSLPAGIQISPAGHPVPDEESLRATANALALAHQAGRGDLLLCLVSGGASALLTRPRLALDDWQALVEALLAAGCPIQAINTVRRELDAVKGGGLARAFAPAACAALILSDVVGSPLAAIGSGPTVPGPSQAAEALALLECYRIEERLSAGAWAAVQAALVSAPEAGRPTAPDVHNVIIGDGRLAAEAALLAARRLGFAARLLTEHLAGEARAAGRLCANLIVDAPAGSCLILAGETTVTLRGDGRGGRNQELALAAAVGLDGWEDRAVAAFATDGEDGPSGAAGAVATGLTAAAGRALGLDPADHLARNDSASFFRPLGGLIETGPTGTNVNDLVFGLHYAC